MKKIIINIFLMIIVCSKIIYANNIFHDYLRKESNQSVSVIATSNPSNMKTYRYNEYAYEVSYPQSYNAVLTGGHSPMANPEYEMRLSLYSKDGRTTLDIDSVNKIDYKDKYENYKDFIKYKRLNLSLDEEITIKNKKNNIYILLDDNYYFSFIENDKHIFQLSSNSKALLKTILSNSRFIY